MHDNSFLQLYKLKYIRDTCIFVKIILSNMLLSHMCFNVYYNNLDFSFFFI